MFSEGWLWEWFGEDVCSNLTRWKVGKSNTFFLDMFSHKVVLNVNVFGTCMELGISGKGNRSLIVDVDVLHLRLMIPGSEVLYYSL